MGKLVAAIVALGLASYALHAWHHDDRNPPICCPSGVQGHCDMVSDAQAQQCIDETDARDERNRIFDHVLIAVDVAAAATLALYAVLLHLKARGATA